VLRRALIAASTSERLRSLAMEHAVARKVADRFVAGETLDDALAVVRELNAAGMPVTLDHLGESVDDPAVAEAAADAYLEALQRIADEGLDCSISVKPTQLGMDLSGELCEKLMGSLCDAAAEVGTHVTIDMESTEHTQRTIDLVLRLRASGRDNVGCAVQSYLRRTLDDVARLTAVGASLRLCKGAYAEPPELAYQEREEVDASYLRAAHALLTSDTFARFATHDHRLIAHIRNLARRLEVPSDRYEFQMLYGIREALQRELVAQGHGMRVYVPYGDQWYPYFVRRLAERPANLVFFLRALVGGR
jgi:proline dehydrogenase